MKHRIMIMVCLAILTVSTIGCRIDQQNSVNNQLVNYENTSYGFSLEYPNNWLIIESAERYGIILKPYDGSITTFYVDTLSFDGTESQTIQTMIDNLTVNRETSVFGEPIETEVNGVSFTKLEYTEIFECTTYYYTAYMTIKEIGYYLIYVSTQDEIDTYADTLEAITQTFRLK